MGNLIEGRTFVQCYESCFGKLAEHLQYLGLIITGNGLAIVPIHRLANSLALLSSNKTRAEEIKKTDGQHAYQGPLEAFGALLEQLHSVALCLCAFDDGGNARLADILQNRLQLVGRGRVLGNV